VSTNASSTKHDNKSKDGETAKFKTDLNEEPSEGELGEIIIPDSNDDRFDLDLWRNRKHSTKTDNYEEEKIIEEMPKELAKSTNFG